MVFDKEKEREKACLYYSEDVRSVPDQMLVYTRSKHYLHATELLNNSGEYLKLVVVCGMCGRLVSMHSMGRVCVSVCVQGNHNLRCSIKSSCLVWCS